MAVYFRVLLFISVIASAVTADDFGSGEGSDETTTSAIRLPDRTTTVHPSAACSDALDGGKHCSVLFFFGLFISSVFFLNVVHHTTHPHAVSSRDILLACAYLCAECVRTMRFSRSYTNTLSTTTTPTTNTTVMYNISVRTNLTLLCTAACSDGDASSNFDVCMGGKCTQCELENPDGTCVSSCEPPLVKDNLSPLAVCTELKPECGKGCIECDGSGTYCIRCHEPLHLELDHTCQKKCADGKPPRIQFVPKLIYECRGERVIPTTAATTTPNAADVVATTSTMPFDVPCPDELECEAVYNRCCRIQPTTTSTTAVLATTAPRATTVDASGPSAGSNAAGTSGKAKSQELAVILAFSISLGLLVVLLAIYCLRRHCKENNMCRSGESAALRETETVGMKTLGERKNSVNDMIRSVTSGKAILQIGGLEDSATADSTEDETPPHKNAAELSGVVRDEFFATLARLKKDQQRIKLLLESMQKRQEAKRTVEGKQKYDTIIDDLSRILALFRQKKAEQKAPADGMQLLSWCSGMVEKFAS